MTVEQASTQEMPARPTPEVPEKEVQVVEEMEEEEKEDLPMAKERKDNGGLLNIMEVKEKADGQLLDHLISDYSIKVRFELYYECTVQYMMGKGNI